MVLGVGPGERRGALAVPIRQKDEIAADQSVKAVLNSLAAKVAVRPNACTHDDSLRRAIGIPVNDGYAQRAGELIDTTRRAQLPCCQDAQIEREKIAIAEPPGQGQLLCPEIVETAAPCQEVVIEREV